MAIKMMVDLNAYLRSSLEETGDDIDAVLPTIGVDSVAFPGNENMLGRHRRHADTVVLAENMKLTRCTDARDKVSAPLGHAADGASGHITVDYSKTLCEVYIDVVRFAITHLRASSLEILGLVFMPSEDISNASLRNKRHPALPSWVTDWRQTVSIPPISKGRHSTGEGSSLCDPAPGIVTEAEIIGGVLFVEGAAPNNLRVTTITVVWDDHEPASRCDSSVVA
ncbi:hypothetical protein F5Y05DRAFT_420495 [Hypoxylon sp. FL0543]|nr:hypothetical protein F5Y05DRAFT_420495 [Hypoxylon sp. FL0543]